MLKYELIDTLKELKELLIPIDQKSSDPVDSLISKLETYVVSESKIKEEVSIIRETIIRKAITTEIKNYIKEADLDSRVRQSLVDSIESMLNNNPIIDKDIPVIPDNISSLILIYNSLE